MGDYIYGSSGDQNSSFMCAVNVQTGKLAWRNRDFSLANVVGVGRCLIILDQDGHLGLATPSAEGLGVQSKIKLLPQWPRTAPTGLAPSDPLGGRSFHAPNPSSPDLENQTQNSGSPDPGLRPLLVRGWLR